MSDASRPTPAPPPTGELRPRILVVDDEPSVCAVVRRILANQELELLEAGSGEEAVAMAERQSGPIDLLLTDLNMPGMDGQRLADTLKARFPAMKVLFLTGLGEILPEGCALEHKPISPRSLRQAVSRQLLGTPDQPPRAVEVEPPQPA